MAQNLGAHLVVGVQLEELALGRGVQDEGVLVFKAHRWLYHSTLGSRLIKKGEGIKECALRRQTPRSPHTPNPTPSSPFTVLYVPQSLNLAHTRQILDLARAIFQEKIFNNCKLLTWERIWLLASSWRSLDLVAGSKMKECAQKEKEHRCVSFHRAKSLPFHA